MKVERKKELKLLKNFWSELKIVDLLDNTKKIKYIDLLHSIIILTDVILTPINQSYPKKNSCCLRSHTRNLHVKFFLFLLARGIYHMCLSMWLERNTTFFFFFDCEITLTIVYMKYFICCFCISFILEIRVHFKSYKIFKFCYLLIYCYKDL